ncbi:MAG: Ig-like domain-containing protein, partial [Chloroflexi bacterium]|nr:Ig-like domain-containing protein [Chloroflexota bacterium]
MASIEGFRGDGLTAANDVDARTVTAADDPGVVDVNVNQTNPNTFTTGGATEFHITDPVVALSGSGTADAPYLRITLNTTNATGITVQYNVRDIDGSTDNAPQQVALHYRVGTSGAWTDVAAAYIADATTGPSVATQVTAVNVTLPAAAENQPSVQLRIMTTNAAGNDEWVGLDDIVISATCSAVDTAPSVSGNTPANGATDVALATNITINFSEAVNTAAGWFSVVCDVSGDISSAVTVSGGPQNFTLDPTANLQYGDDCTVTVNA